MYGISPASSPTDATIYPFPACSVADAVGSNNVTYSASPPANAPAIKSKLMLSSNTKSFCGSIPFCFNTYSSVIYGTPPFLPGITVFPFKSVHLKSSVGSLLTKNEPSLCVICANTCA